MSDHQEIKEDEKIEHLLELANCAYYDCADPELARDFCLKIDEIDETYYSCAVEELAKDMQANLMDEVLPEDKEDHRIVKASEYDWLRGKIIDFVRALPLRDALGGFLLIKADVVAPDDAEIQHMLGCHNHARAKSFDFGSDDYNRYIDQAVYFYQRVLALSPFDSAVYKAARRDFYAIPMSLFRQGATEKAREVMQLMRGICPEYPYPPHFLGLTAGDKNVSNTLLAEAYKKAVRYFGRNHEQTRDMYSDLYKSYTDKPFSFN